MIAIQTDALLRREDTLLLVVDAQERLLPALHDSARALANVRRLVAFAAQIGVPVEYTEQEKLGPTAAVLRALWGGAEPVVKREFDALSNAVLAARLAGRERRCLLLAGFEAHICVAQTALHASEHFAVQVVADAVASRDPENRLLALDRLRAAGVTVTSTEMVIYELLRQAGTDEFRAALPLVK
jgi:isochorismate hydrolase